MSTVGLRGARPDPEDAQTLARESSTIGLRRLSLDAPSLAALVHRWLSAPTDKSGNTVALV